MLSLMAMIGARSLFFWPLLRTSLSAAAAFKAPRHLGKHKADTLIMHSRMGTLLNLKKYFTKCLLNEHIIDPVCHENVQIASAYFSTSSCPGSVASTACTAGTARLVQPS